MVYWILFSVGITTVVIGAVVGILFRSGYRLKKTLKAEDFAKYVNDRGSEDASNAPDVLDKEYSEKSIRFFESISHEIRTPLTLIKGHSGDIARKCSNTRVPGLVEDVDAIDHQVQALEYHIENLLEAVEAEPRQDTHLDKTKCNITAQLMQLADFLDTNLSIGKDSFTMNFPPKKIELLVDKRKIDRAILAVVAEGLIKLKVGATVTLSLDVEEIPSGSICVISVAFKGHSVDEDDRDERLLHLSSLLRSLYIYGNAGLVNVQKWITAHGGTFSTDEISGSEFTYQIRLPNASVLPNDRAVAAEGNVGGVGEISDRKSGVHQPEKHNDKPTILIVEDNKAIQKYLVTLLKRDYNVLKEEDGIDGLQTAKSRLPDLIISDIVMPRMDGLEFCEQVRKDRNISFLPFIMLTSKIGEHDRLEGLKIGADSYIQKPFSAEILRETVKNHLSSRKRLLRKMDKDEKGEYSLPVSTKDDFLKQMDRAINSRIDDYDLSIKQLAKELNVSPRQLQRKVKSLSGLTPKKYLRYRRLKAAEYLLKNGTGSVTEVAYTVGFNNLSLFASYFKEEFGELPSTLKSAN